MRPEFSKYINRLRQKGQAFLMRRTVDQVVSGVKRRADKEAEEVLRRAGQEELEIELGQVTLRMVRDLLRAQSRLNCLNVALALFAGGESKEKVFGELANLDETVSDAADTLERQESRFPRTWINKNLWLNLMRDCNDLASLEIHESLAAIPGWKESWREAVSLMRSYMEQRVSGAFPRDASAPQG